MSRKPIRGRARRLAAVTLIAAAVSFAAPAVANAAVHVDGIGGTDSVVSSDGIQGTGK